MTSTLHPESKETAAALHHYLRVEPNVGSAIWARFMDPYIAGTDPVCESTSLANGTDIDAAFASIPTELVSRLYRSENNSTVLIEAPTYAAIVQQYAHHNGSITVRAATAELATKAIAEISAWFPIVDPPATSVSVDFWQMGRQMFTTSRTIDAPKWEEVDHHYPAEIHRDLDSLMSLELADPDGRVILWHGPPGTGKTSAIRSLARAWRGQATFQIVLDPEPVFSQSAHLMQVILNSHDDESSEWRVLVIEDADEIVRADNAATSLSLSRLLNVGDGIVGQGLKVLVLLTTNEPPSRLHPALTRPGRCLANVAFRKFTRAEAAASFPENDMATISSGPGELSLAEILTGRLEDTGTNASHGQYL